MATQTGGEESEKRKARGRRHVVATRRLARSLPLCVSWSAEDEGQRKGELERLPGGAKSMEARLGREVWVGVWVDLVFG